MLTGLTYHTSKEFEPVVVGTFTHFQDSSLSFHANQLLGKVTVELEGDEKPLLFDKFTVVEVAVGYGHELSTEYGCSFVAYLLSDTEHSVL